MHTISTFLDMWLESRSLNIRPATVATYRRTIDLVTSLVGDRPLDGFKTLDGETLLARMAKRGLSQRDRLMAYIVLKAAFDRAVKWELVAKNPMRDVEKPKVEKKEMKVWTADQARLFLDVTEGTEDFPIYALALMLGMRQGEILGLQWEDVDLDRGVLQVRQQLSEVGGKIVGLAPVKTSKGNRSVTLNARLVAALRLHQKVTGRKEGFVFLKYGEPRKKADIHYVFKRDTRKCGLPEIRFHDLRHTNVTLLISKGVDAKTIQGRVGHSQVSVTLDTYAKFLKAADVEAANKMEEMFS